MKWTEIRQMSDDALRSELEKLSEERRNLRFQEMVGPLENPLLKRKARRATARIQTLLRERAASAAKGVKA